MKSSGILLIRMSEHANIIGDWFSGQTTKNRNLILKSITASMTPIQDQRVEQIASELAAGLMAACSEDLGLSILELAGLLSNPRRDAIASLITVLRDGQ